VDIALHATGASASAEARGRSPRPRREAEARAWGARRGTGRASGESPRRGRSRCLTRRGSCCGLQPTPKRRSQRPLGDARRRRRGGGTRPPWPGTRAPVERDPSGERDAGAVDRGPTSHSSRREQPATTGACPTGRPGGRREAARARRPEHGGFGRRRAGERSDAAWQARRTPRGASSQSAAAREPALTVTPRGDWRRAARHDSPTRRRPPGPSGLAAMPRGPTSVGTPTHGEHELSAAWRHAARGGGGAMTQRRTRGG